MVPLVRGPDFLQLSQIAQEPVFVLLQFDQVCVRLPCVVGKLLADICTCLPDQLPVMYPLHESFQHQGNEQSKGNYPEVDRDVPPCANRMWWMYIQGVAPAAEVLKLKTFLRR